MTFETVPAGSRSSNWLRIASEASPRVLLVEDSFDYAFLVQSALALSEIAEFEIEWTACLRTASWFMENALFNAVLLDLSLPDSLPLSTIEWCTRWAEALPVIVLTGADDEGLARAALEGGARDFLVKDQIDCRSLPDRLLGLITGTRWDVPTSIDLRQN